MAFTIGPNATITVPILSDTILEHLKNACVIVPYASTEFEGEIKGKGTVVSVQVFPTITFNVGTKTGEKIPKANFTITKEDLTIDELRTVNVPVGKFESYIANFDMMDKLAKKIAEQVEQTADAAVAAAAIAGAHSSHKIATSVLTKDNIFETIEKIAVLMNKANVSKADRGLFVTPEA